MSVEVRAGRATDAQCIGLLSIHVFLDTYATCGVRPDLAREAMAEYSPGKFAERLADRSRAFRVAEIGDGLVGYVELRLLPAPAPAGSFEGVELIRVYVQPRAQRSGLGTRLLADAEAIAGRSGARGTWLTAWSGNDRALAFYRACGYRDLGSTPYAFEGHSYENRVLAKDLVAS